MPQGARKSRKQKILTALYVVLAVCVALSLYTVFASLVSRFHWRADMTEGEVFRLTDVTEVLLSGLTRDVSLTCLNNENDADTNITELLGRYEKASPHIRVRYKDLAVNPAFAEPYEAQGFTLKDDAILVECGGAIRLIEWEDLYRISSSAGEDGGANYVITGFAAESQISAAIAAVSTDEPVRVVFTAGHSEDTEGRLGELIAGSGYEVGRCVLEAADLPEETDVVLLAGARIDFSQSEIEKITRHLNRGGSLVVFRDPTVGELPRLDALCEAWGIEIGNDIVLESSQYMGDPATLIPVFGTSLINVYFSERSTYVVMPTARQLRLSQEGEGMVNAVLKSTSSSYAKDFSSYSGYEKSASDPEGPFNLAATSERVYTDENGEERSQYVFVMACTDFYEDVYLDTQSLGNADFVLQVLSHLTQHDVSLNIPVKDLKPENIVISRPNVVIFAAIFVIIIPLAILLLGLARYMKRRRA